MKKFNKRYLTIIFFVLVFSFVIICLVLKQNNHVNIAEEFIYDSGDSGCNYSEHSILYLDDSGILHMIDTDTGKDIVYCDRPNCTHEAFSHNNENPSCPAVFYGLNKSGTVLYNNHLYFIGNMSNQDIMTQYLYEMDTNGEKRKKVATIEGVEAVKYVLYRDNYVVGAYVNRCELNDDGQIINDNKPEAGIFVVNLDNYEVYMSDKIIGEQANITGIYYENGMVYYTGLCFGEDITELMLEASTENDTEDFVYENMMYEIHRYDIEHDNTLLVRSFDHINYFQMIDGDVYYETREGYFVFDKNSGVTNELNICKADEMLYGELKKFDATLYYALLDNAVNEVTYYRLEKGKNDELLKLPVEASFGIANICGKSAYVNYTNDSGQFCLGVLSIDDLNHGKFNVKELRCYGETVTENNYVTEETNSKIITFAVPDICRVDDDKLLQFNEALIEDGHDYMLEFKYLEYEEYSDLIKSELIYGDIDIAFLGLGDSNGDNKIYDIINSGLVLKLDEILLLDKGEALYNAFPQNLWESVKCNKHIYSIPSVLANEQGVYAAFNKDYISDDVIKKWDESIDGIYEIIKNVEWNNSDAYPFQYLINDYSFEDMIKSEIRYGLIFDYESLSIDNPLKSEKYIGYLNVLNRMKEAGYLDNSISYLANIGLNDSKVLKNINEGNYAIVLAAGSVNEAFVKDNIIVKKVTPYLSSRINGSIGISNNTDDIDAVVDFLSLLYADGKYSNILLYGCEGTDYRVVDGVAYNIDGTELDDDYITKLCLNLFVNIYPVSCEAYITNRKKDIFSFYKNINLSPFIGFEADTTKLKNISNDLDGFMNSLKDMSVDKAVLNAMDKFETDGGKVYLDSVKGQWEEYKQ